MSIVVYRLTSGEEIIGEPFDDPSRKNMISIRNPVLIMFGQDARGNVGAGSMVPFPFSRDVTKKESEIVHLNPSTIMCVIDHPHEALAKSYREQFGSGIITPASKLILG